MWAFAITWRLSSVVRRLSSVVRRLSYVVCRPLTFHILIFSSETPGSEKISI